MKKNSFLVLGMPALTLALTLALALVLGLTFVGCATTGGNEVINEVTYESAWDDLVRKYDGKYGSVYENDNGDSILPVFYSGKRTEIDAKDQQVLDAIRAYAETYPERFREVYNNNVGWTYDTSGDPSLAISLMYKRGGPVFDIDVRWRDVPGHRINFALWEVKLDWVTTVVKDLLAMAE
jgi:hypothetical protein